MERKFEIDLKTVGSRIRNARHTLRLTQEKAAERTTLTGQYWSLIETGRMRGSVATYLQITAALDLTLDDLFYGDAKNLQLQKSMKEDDLLTDCTAAEKAIISETMLTLKSALARNRS